jgi:arylsulfatase A-like enzyme
MMPNRIQTIMTLVVMAMSLGCNETPRPSPRYNILWITAEDLSPRLGCYGDSIAITPNIDRLAEEGVRYTNVYSVSGVCAPSRAALITGLYPVSFGAMHMRTTSRTAALDQVTDPEALAIPVYEAVPPPEVKCFPEFLRAKGYFCTNNSKTDYQFHAPITAWDENGRNAHWRNRPEGMPFFSVFNFPITHESQVWSRAHESEIVRPEDVVLPPYYADTPIIRRDVARHYSNIARLDSAVGELLAQLRDDGLTDSTIIFFYTDHGDGLPRSKRWVYDSGLKVPLIIRYPNLHAASSVDSQLISFVDFAPTMLTLAGVPVPAYMQGRSFLGTQKPDPRQYVFAARDRMDPALETIRAVRDDRFKYIKNYHPERPYVQSIPYRDQMGLMQEMLRLDREGKLQGAAATWFRKTKPPEELYDTQNDPHELNNLAGMPEYTAVLDRLRNELAGWEKQVGDLGHIPEPQLVRRLWPDGEQPQTSAPEIFDGRGSDIRLRCATDGASIAYRLNDSEGRWLLYTGPIARQGVEELEAQAVRIGFKPSEVLRSSF